MTQEDNSAKPLNVAPVGSTENIKSEDKAPQDLPEASMQGSEASGPLAKHHDYPDDRQAPLTPGEIQDILGRLHDGNPPTQLIAKYGAGRKKTVYRLQRELEQGLWVGLNGKWVSKDVAERSDIEKAGDAAETQAAKGVLGAVSKETRDEAVRMTSRKMELGAYLLDQHQGAAARAGKTLEGFIDQCVSFWAIHNEYVDYYYDKWSASFDLNKLCIGTIVNLLKRNNEWEFICNNLVEKLREKPSAFDDLLSAYVQNEKARLIKSILEPRDSWVRELQGLLDIVDRLKAKPATDQTQPPPAPAEAPPQAPTPPPQLMSTATAQAPPPSSTRIPVVPGFVMNSGSGYGPNTYLPSDREKVLAYNKNLPHPPAEAE